MNCAVGDATLRLVVGTGVMRCVVNDVVSKCLAGDVLRCVVHAAVRSVSSLYLWNIQYRWGLQSWALPLGYTDY